MLLLRNLHRFRAYSPFEPTDELSDLMLNLSKETLAAPKVNFSIERGALKLRIFGGNGGGDSLRNRLQEEKNVENNLYLCIRYLYVFVSTTNMYFGAVRDP